MVALQKQQPLDYNLLIEEAKQKLLKSVRWGGNASGAFVQDDGCIHINAGTGCHSFLTQNSGVMYIITGLQEGSDYGDNPGRVLDKEVEVWFLDYILNRSPYADTFVTKDAEEALEERLVVSSTDHEGCLVGGAIVALRRLWEHVYVAHSAYDLVQAGVNEDLAFILGHCIQAPSEIESNTIVSWTADLNWHTSIDPSYMGFGAVKNFMQHKVLTKNGTYFNTGRYRGYSAMYGSGNPSIFDYIHAKFPCHLYKDNKKVQGNNPFAASKPKAIGLGKTAPYSKAIEVMAEWAKTELMEKINNA